MENNLKNVTDKVVGSILYPGEYSNIEKSERVISAAFGAFLFWKGVKDIFSNPSSSVWELIIGGGLIYRGATGYCAVKERLESCNPIEDEEKERSVYIVESM